MSGVLYNAGDGPAGLISLSCHSYLIPEEEDGSFRVLTGRELDGQPETNAHVFRAGEPLAPDPGIGLDLGQDELIRVGSSNETIG